MLNREDASRPATTVTPLVDGSVAALLDTIVDAFDAVADVAVAAVAVIVVVVVVVVVVDAASDDVVRSLAVVAESVADAL